MIFEEYLEKNEKSQNVSGEAALDDDALNAVAGGLGDIGVEVGVNVKDKDKKEIVTNTTTIKDDHSNHSIVKKHLTTDGGLETDGLLSF